MKKELIISLLFLLMSLILPAGALLPLFGLTMTVVHPTALLILYAVAAVILTLADLRIQSEKQPSLFPRIFLPTAAAISGLFLIAENDHLPWAGLPVVFAFACSIILCRRLRRSIPLSLLKFILHGVPGAALVLLSLAAILFSGFGAEYTYPEQTSPDGKYIASAVIVDQGALGGDTVVRIYRAGELNLGLLKIRRPAAETHYSDWRRPDQFRMEWLDDHTLRVNGEEYRIES